MTILYYRVSILRMAIFVAFQPSCIFVKVKLYFFTFSAFSVTAFRFRTTKNILKISYVVKILS